MVSNASMTTFCENTLSQFTTLLPQQLNLSGFWEVAVAQNAWPAAIENITYGQFKYPLAAEELKVMAVAIARKIEKTSKRKALRID